MSYRSVPEVESGVSMAIKELVSKAASSGHLEGVGNGAGAYVKVSTPPDGLCFYHCILASLHYDTWSSVSRTPIGFATNKRVVKQEADSAMSLRELALKSTPTDNTILQALAQTAGQKLTVDIVEISWAAHSLNLTIRCTIDDEASMPKIQKNLGLLKHQFVDEGNCKHTWVFLFPGRLGTVR